MIDEIWTWCYILIARQQDSCDWSDKTRGGARHIGSPRLNAFRAPNHEPFAAFARRETLC